MIRYRIITNGTQFGVQKFWKLGWFHGWNTVTDGFYHPANRLRFSTRERAKAYCDLQIRKAKERAAVWKTVEECEAAA